MSAYEFTVVFEVETDEEASAVVEAVLLAVCGGKGWKHHRPWRWFGRWLTICPRSFCGFGPYKVLEDGTLENGDKPKFWGVPSPAYRPVFPSVWANLNSNTAQEPEWSEKAATCIRTLAEYLPEFTADDLRDAIGDPPRLNLMGAVFLRAHKAGLITLVGYRASKRRERHANRVAVWRGVGS